ncbi:MAG: DUF4393 domain-containing protein [Defluviitaleaceae bacterium]|nr:DUF4393 domain-containing protein [Defluviitaleaceae bacterium]
MSKDAAKEFGKELGRQAGEDFRPAMKSASQALTTVIDCVNLVLSPLRLANLVLGAQMDKVWRSLAEKYEKIPPEMCQEPDLKIVHQISDKLKYSLDSDELRDMFENLLISSMTKGRTVHPLFVDIIDKMTTEDAQLFKLICNAYSLVTPVFGLELLLVEFFSFNSINVSSVDDYRSNHFLCCPTFCSSGKISGDVFEKLSNTEYLPKHDNVRFHIDILDKLGLIEQQVQEKLTEKRRLFGFEGSSVEKDNGHEWQKYRRAIERPDIAEWVEHNRIFHDDSSTIVGISPYKIAVFGRRLHEALQSPCCDNS